MLTESQQKTIAQNLATLSNAQESAKKLLKKDSVVKKGDLQLLVQLDTGSLNAALSVGGVKRAIDSDKALLILENTVKWTHSEMAKSETWAKSNATLSASYLVSQFCKKFVKPE